MDKEKLITIGIGLLVGILFAGSYFLAIKLLPQLRGKQDTVIFTPSNPTTPPAPKNALDLNLSAPDNFIATSEATITFLGQTAPQSRIIIVAPSDEKVASADASGNFNSPVKLEEGENEISVTAIDSAGNVATVKRSVTLEISP